MRHLICALFTLALLASCRNETNDVDDPAPPQEPAKPLTLSTDPTGLPVQTTATGTVMHLDGRYQNAVVAHRHADGSIGIACHDEQVQAEAFMNGAPRPTTQLEVK